MNLTRNFTEKELACPCCDGYDMDEILLNRLQAYRDLLGFPLIITSGYRCSVHNQEVGGGDSSQHLFGKAVDIKINKFNAATRYRLIKTAFEMGFMGIGIGKNHFHLDIREGEKKSWGYS